MSAINVAVEIVEITIAGLFIAFSPMLFIVNLLIVTKSKRPVVDTVVLLISMALPLLLLGFVASLLLRPEMDISFRNISQHLSMPPLINVIVGIALMLWAVRKIIHQRNLSSMHHALPQEPQMPTTKIVPLFMFGFTKSLLSVSNIFAVLFVTKLTLEKGLPESVAFIVLAWAVVIGLTPFFAVLYYSRSHPEYIARLQAKINVMLGRNIKLYAYIAVTIIGFWLVASGILQGLHS